MPSNKNIMKYFHFIFILFFLAFPKETLSAEMANAK